MAYKTSAPLAVLLTAGVLSLTACGGTSAASPAAATSTPKSTPSAVASPSTPASAPSTPASSTPAGGSDSSSTKVTAGPASPADIAQFTAAARGKCGFTKSADKLTAAKVTNNGWGSATVTAKNPADQGNESMVFRMGSGWTMDQCGSDFGGSGIPQNVLDALGL